MINIKLDSDDIKTDVAVYVWGDMETITHEILIILNTFAEKCPEAYFDAIKRHSIELNDKEAKK